MARFTSPGGETVESDNPGVIAYYVRKGYTPADVAEDQPTEPKDLDKMTRDELREYAKAHDIDLGGATKKDDLLAAIRDAEGVQVGDGFDPGEPVEGVVGGEPVTITGDGGQVGDEPVQVTFAGDAGDNEQE